MVVALLITGGMTYFNNVLLPDANHRASALWRDIRTKRPGFSLQPGVFYNGVDHYSILVRDRLPGTNRLVDVTIYDYTRGRRRQAVIKAARGSIDPDPNGTSLTLRLEDGEMHRTQPPSGVGAKMRYERLRFDRHTLRLDLSDFAFERSSPRENRRSDRTMRTVAMVGAVDSLQAEVEESERDLLQHVGRTLFPDTVAADASADAPRFPEFGGPPDDGAGGESVPSPFVALQGLSQANQKTVAASAVRTARSLESRIRGYERNVRWKKSRIVRYQVEIYKKFSIATACLVFMFIGIPLGLSIRRGGLATIGALALGIFMFHWVTLVQGEKMADRGLLEPWIGMWVANVLMLLVGIWLVVYVVLDLRATPPLRARLWRWLKDLTSGD
jgi:lipopolysaccharide export system permease protein